MIRRSSAVLVLALGLSGLAVPPAFAADTPSAPASIEVVPTAAGPRIAWGAAATGSPTSYTVWRQLDGQMGPTQLADVSTLSYVDETLDRGVSATYGVWANNDAGPGSSVAAPPFQRQASDPAAGTTEALVLDVDSTTIASALDAAPTRTGDVLAAAGNAASVRLPRVPAPGTYSAADRPLAVRVDNTDCNATSGTIDVAEALYDAGGEPVTYAATFAVACFGTTVHGVVRHHSTSAYKAVTTSVPAGTWTVPNGSGDRTVTFNSAGSAGVTFGAATLSGADAAHFSIASNGCAGQSIANGTTCDVVVHSTATGTQTRNVTLSVADDTARGGHAVALAAVPGAAPSAPAGISIADVRIGQITAGWNPPASNGNSPVTAYRLYRQVGEEAPVLVHDGMAPMFRDARAPGLTQRYGATAVNAVGEGPAIWTAYVTSPAADVVYARGGFQTPSGLYRNVPGRNPIDVATDGDHGTPAVSPDGTLIAYAKQTANGIDVWVRNLDGSGTPRNLTAAMSGASMETDPAFSNDGKLVAFTRYAGDVATVHHVSVTGGPATLRGTNVANPSFLADSRSLVVTDFTSESAPLVRIAPNNARATIPGTAYGDEAAVSPDGRWLAFSRYDVNNDIYGIGVVPAGGAASPRLFTDSAGWLDRSEPAWRGDGAALAYTLYNWYSETGGIFQVSWDGTAFGALPTVTSSAEAYAPAWRSLGMRLVSAPTVTGADATVAFALSAPFTTAMCKLDAGAPAPCASTWTGTALAAGTHTLLVTASAPGVDDRVLAHTFTVDRAAPVLSISLPNTTFTNAATAYFRYAGSDPSGVAGYDARYRKAAHNGAFGAYVSPAGWTNTRSTQLPLAVAAGYEYCFSVRARDAVGNVSAWSAERCVGSPLDDRSLGTSASWSRLGATGFYRNTYTSTTRSGATMSVAGVQAKRLVLVATRCPTCGTVAVYMGTTLVANVNLASATTVRGAHLALPVFGAVRSGTVTIKVTSSGKAVQIDGLGTRRT